MPSPSRACQSRFHSLESWKKTSLGTPIGLYSSRPLTELQGHRPIVLMGGVHGDEPEGVRLANDTLDWLKECSSTVDLSPNTREQGALAPWVLIPCLNVDGFAKQTRVNGRGVDLNRNYPSRDWTAEFEKERYFPGLTGGSEIEVQGIVELIRDLRPRLIIHCHSYHPCIVGTGELASTDAARLGASSGFAVVPEIGYPTPGSLSRYGWHDHGIPVICIEEDDKNKNLDAIWPRFRTGMAEVFGDVSLRGSAPDDRSGSAPGSQRRGTR